MVKIAWPEESSHSTFANIMPYNEDSSAREFGELNVEFEPPTTNSSPLQPKLQIQKLKESQSQRIKQGTFKKSENERLLQELTRPGQKAPHTIPYEFVGADIKDALSIENYPDWHMLTPAYDLANSGMTKGQLVKSFFNLNSSNFCLWRIGRWMTEKKAVIYCNKTDKAATLVAFMIILISMMLVIWQLWIGAEIQYKFVNDKTEDGKQKNSFWLDRLNRLESNLGWRIFKAALSFFSGMFLMAQVFKRTTIPRQNVKIISFKPDHIVEPPPDGRTKSGKLTRRKSHVTVPTQFWNPFSKRSKVANSGPSLNDDV